MNSRMLFGQESVLCSGSILRQTFANDKSSGVCLKSRSEL